jgi:hypothetical protein
MQVLSETKIDSSAETTVAGVPPLHLPFPASTGTDIMRKVGEMRGIQSIIPVATKQSLMQDATAIAQQDPHMCWF